MNYAAVIDSDEIVYWKSMLQNLGKFSEFTRRVFLCRVFFIHSSYVSHPQFIPVNHHSSFIFSLKLNVKQSDRGSRKFLFLVVELGLYCDVAIQHLRGHHLTLRRRLNRADPRVGGERFHRAHRECPLLEWFAFELGTLNNSEVSELLDGAEVDFPENCFHIENVCRHTSFVKLIGVGEVLRLLPDCVAVFGVCQLDPVAKSGESLVNVHEEIHECFSHVEKTYI